LRISSQPTKPASTTPSASAAATSSVANPASKVTNGTNAWESYT
jgi:hypothetical protein